jgi:hypothetical protein
LCSLCEVVATQIFQPRVELTALSCSGSVAGGSVAGGSDSASGVVDPPVATAPEPHALSASPNDIHPASRHRPTINLPTSIAKSLLSRHFVDFLDSCQRSSSACRELHAHKRQLLPRDSFPTNRSLSRKLGVAFTSTSQSEPCASAQTLLSLAFPFLQYHQLLLCLRHLLGRLSILCHLEQLRRIRRSSMIVSHIIPTGAVLHPPQPP